MRREEDAREWLKRRLDVSRETLSRLNSFAELLREENERQNLVSASTLDHIWWRHIADSAQLLAYAGTSPNTWLDLGSGAGFPGLIVAMLRPMSVTLVEKRTLRADFLRRAADMLGVRVEIFGEKLERFPPRLFDVISARAFAPLPQLLDLGTAFSTTKTIWVLPKGKKASAELEALDPSWQGDFRLEPSLTDPEAKIIVATGVRRGGKRKRG